MSTAEVTRLEIARRELVLNGKPSAPRDRTKSSPARSISRSTRRSAQWRHRRSRARAARMPGACVEFSADFYLLKPVDPAQRQRPPVLRSRQPRHEADPSSLSGCRRLRGSDDGRRIRQRRADAARASRCSGWVAMGRARRPHADGDSHRDRATARPITGWVRGNFIPGANATTALIADRGHQPYPVVDPESAEHVIRRTLPTGSAAR